MAYYPQYIENHQHPQYIENHQHPQYIENYQHNSESNIWKFLTYFQIQGDPLMLTSRTNATFEEVIMFMDEYNCYNEVSMTNACMMDNTNFYPFFPMDLSQSYNMNWYPW